MKMNCYLFKKSKLSSRKTSRKGSRVLARRKRKWRSKDQGSKLKRPRLSRSKQKLWKKLTSSLVVSKLARSKLTRVLLRW